MYPTLPYLFGIRSLVYFLLFASNVPLVKTVDSGQIVVRIPATDPLATSGPLSISYEQISTLGGHWSSATLVVNEKTPGTG